MFFEYRKAVVIARVLDEMRMNNHRAFLNSSLLGELERLGDVDYASVEYKTGGCFDDKCFDDPEPHGHYRAVAMVMKKPHGLVEV